MHRGPDRPQRPARRVAILAGGQSRRMGSDKALLALEGRPLLTRIARAAQAAGAGVVVVGRARDRDLALDDVQFVPDALPGQGPLGGLHTALLHAAGDAVLLVACDMPNLTAAAFSWLFGIAEGLALYDGLVVVHEARPEPLFAIYTASCRPLVLRHLATRELSMRALIGAGRFARAVATPEVADALVNLNTPSELCSYRSAGSAS